MASPLTKRPVPALVALLALLLLTALVWWRVLHRGGSSAPDKSATCPTPTQTQHVDTLPAPSTITLKVLNSTNRTGIAARARSTLVGDGFKVPDEAANDSPKAKIPGIAEIRFGPTGRTAAAVLRYYFPGAKLVTNTSKTAVVVVSLGDKYRAVATPAAVRAALTADHKTLAPTSGTTSSGSASC